MRKCNKKELEFIVFIINKLFDYLKKPVYEIYKILKETQEELEKFYMKMKKSYLG
jgi:asparagine synthetase A